MGLEEGRQKEPQGAQDAHEHEHPQEQPVHHHGHVLPVLDDLWGDRKAGYGCYAGIPPSLARPAAFGQGPWRLHVGLNYAPMWQILSPGLA